MRPKRILYTTAALFFVLVLVACDFEIASNLQSVRVSESTSTSQSSSIVLPFDAQENWEGALPKGMIRGWYGSTSTGSGYVNRYLFEGDGTFYFAQNANLAGERLRYMDGGWQYENGVIMLTVMRKIVVEGGEYVEGDAALPLPNDIIGGTRVKVELTPDSYEIIQLPLEMINTDDQYPEGDDIKGSIMLGDEQYWAKGGIAYNEMLTYWDFPEYV